MNQNEEIQWEALNSILPNDPDKWRKPALNEKKILTEDDIRNFIIRVEDELELPLGVLSMPGKGTIKGHSIPSVKQAIIYHLSSVTTVRQKVLAPYVGIPQQNIGYHVQEAKNHMDTKDETFEYYYLKIQNIAV
jgi:hypothetical protein